MMPGSNILLGTLDRFARGWPEHGANAGPAVYGSLAAALTGRFPDDRHCAAYSLPTIPHRLATVAALEQSGGVPMVLAIFDIDDVVAKHEKRAPTAEWRAAERAKVERLFAAYPGGFCFTTRGGHRIVYRLPAPIVLQSTLDARRWSARYVGWLDHLADTFGIQGDTACGDWTRLYRLPRVVRDGQVQVPETLGDPAAVGVWPVEVDVSSVTEYAPPPRPNLPPPPIDATAREQAIHDLAAHWPPPGYRHRASHALCGALAKSGMELEAIADLVTEVSRRAGAAGGGDYGKRHGQAARAIYRYENGLSLTGWGKLKEVDRESGRPFLPEAVVDAVQERLFPPDRTMADIVAMAVAQQKADVAAAAALDRVLGVAPPVPAGAPAPATLSRDELVAHYQIVRKKLSRRTSSILDSVDATYLGRVLARRETLADADDAAGADPLGSAATALARHAPAGATDEQLASLLARYVRDPSEATAAIAAARAAGAAPTAGGMISPQGFVLDPRTSRPSTGPKHLQANIRRALELSGLAVRQDQFAYAITISTAGGDAAPMRAEDETIQDLMLAFEEAFELRAGSELFHAVIASTARKNAYHPVCDYLDSLPTWDGVPRIGNWLVAYGGAEDTPFNRAVGRIVLVAAVRRVRQPGCKFDEMLILEGEQGCGKSTALRTLAVRDEWFGDNLPLGEDDPRKQLEAISGRWIMEAGELSGMQKGAVTELKRFLSAQEDSARMAYARINTRRKRQCVLIGTTNEGTYLRDTSGNRRYWPVKVRGFDVDALKREREQLWAEAAAAEADGESIRLAPELYAAATEVQEERRVEDPFVDMLEMALGDATGKLHGLDVWKILELEPGRNANASNRIGAVMQRLGWEHKKARFNGRSVQCYLRGTEEQRRHALRVDGGPASGWRVRRADEPPEIVVTGAVAAVN